MARAAKVSISLPDDLLRSVEARRHQSRETRSDFFRRAAESLLRQDREREAVDRYVAGYLAQPETEAEIAWGELGAAHLSQEEW